MFAGGLVGIIASLIGLVCLVLWIIVLIKQFQDAGAVHGIIGIVTCGIWTFIWGWMNATRLNIKNIMLIWTLLIIVGFVLRIFFIGISIPTTAPTP
jgi:hypothetical protein